MQKDNKVPMYYQICEEITKWLEEGTYKEGDKLPSENELVKLFGVSKITVNKALLDLVNQGKIYRIQGKGTFVQGEVFTRASKSFLSFTKEYIEKGFDLKTQIIEYTIIKDEIIAGKLHAASNEDIFKLARLRCIDNKIIAYQISYMRKSIASDLNFDKTESLYEVLQESGIEPQKAIERYKIIKIQEEKTARLLQVKIGEPAFYVTRLSYDKKGRLFEYGTSYLKWDSYTVEVIIEK